MSDPVSSMDVEDVLSSIRRLVSEEAKGTGPHGESTAGIASSGLHEAADNVAGEALDEIVNAMDGSDDENPIGTPPSNDISDDMDDMPDELRVSFRHQAASAARRAGDQKLVLTDAFRVAEPAKDDDNTEVNSSDDAEASETSSSPHPHLRPVDNDVLKEPTLRAATFSTSPEEALFDRADQEMSGIRAIEPVAASEPEHDDFDTPETDAFDSIEDAEEVDADEVEKFEATEQLADADALEAEPVEEISNASPFSTAGGVFAQQAETVEAPVNDTKAEEEEPSTINFTEEEGSVLDEETLRDLVSEMVREELQGELGDRITRNVRKLVRREIQRSLASREFE